MEIKGVRDFDYRDGWGFQYPAKPPVEKVPDFFEPIFRCRCGQWRHITSTFCIVCLGKDN